MLFQSLKQHFTHTFDPNNYRLVMTILCKDEKDIIEANIRVHAALGVDAFAVMDNLSTDGTREILESLKEEFELHVIDQRDPVYKQSEWMTELAYYARERLGADWVISNDADEFWIPSSTRSLKEILARKGSVLTCHRYNMLLEEHARSEDFKFYDGALRVDNPIYYHNEQLSKENATIVLSKIGPKVIVNPHGLLKVKGGNHRAKHVSLQSWINYMKPYDKLKKVNEINVYHYSMRGWKHFENNIINRKRLLEEHENVRMGNHYRRWVELYNQGTLETEFEKFIFKADEIDVLKKFGVICHDSHPGDIIRRIIEGV